MPGSDWPEAPEGLSEIAPEGLAAGIKSPRGVGGGRRVLPQKGGLHKAQGPLSVKDVLFDSRLAGSPYANLNERDNMYFSILKFRDPPCVGVVV